ncbi:MAG TPA: hypothetical protein VGR18_12245 [Rubrobacter sp.]|nr:hypothetical protein [Rubrobacter sp.]
MRDETACGPPGIDEDMSAVAAGIRALRELALDPVGSEDGARVYDFSIRWGVLMSGRLKRLEHYYRAGELTEEQERAYRQLRGELGEAAPLAKGLGIGWPTVPLED